jgi:hypothetical protein
MDPNQILNPYKVYSWLFLLKCIFLLKNKLLILNISKFKIIKTNCY